MSIVSNLIKEIEGSYLSLEAKDNQRPLTVIGILDEYFNHITFDKALGKKLYRYQIGYVNTSRDYVEFFGSNLLGVHVIRFKESDVLRFFNEVIDIDYDALEHAIRQTTTIDHTFIVSGDIFNLTLMYMIHRCLSEKSLNEKDRHWLAHNTALIFFYRAVAALLSAYFTYPADPKIAQAAYANLSFKYLIKQLGSWHKVMDYRANEIVNPSGIHYSRLYKLSQDQDLVKIINAAANSMKDMIKNYYSEFARVHAQGDKISTTQTTGYDVEGEEVVKDNIKNIDKSIAFARHLLTDPGALIREDYIRVISDINRNISPRLLRETLFWICANASGKDHKLIDEAISSIIIYSFYLIQTRIEPSRIKDLPYVLIQLKNLYLSSRSTDQDLVKIRTLTDQILSKTHQKLSTALLLSIRTSLILYITFRVMIGQKKY